MRQVLTLFSSPSTQLRNIKGKEIALNDPLVMMSINS